MVFDTIGRYEFDTLWIWGYDFDMVLLCSWYGLGYGLDMFRYGFGMFWMWFWYGVDMVWERSAFFRVPDGLASRKETETAPGQPFGRFLGFFLWFWYDSDMILIRFWYAFDTILDMVPMGWLQITILTHIKNHNWNHIKIISKTVSTS